MIKQNRSARRSKTSVQKTLDLLTQEERRQRDASPSHVRAPSRTSEVRNILEHAKISQRMLGEILAFLSGRADRVRATNVFTSLPGILDLPPRLNKLLIDWSRVEERQARLDDLWHSAEAALESLVLAASDHQRNGLRTQGHLSADGWVRGRKTQTCDAEAVAVLTALVPSLAKAVPRDHSSDWVRRIGERVRDFEERLEEIIIDAGFYPASDWSESHDQDRSDVERFIEDVREYLACENGLQDSGLVENEIFRNLPQLYEVWVLCDLLRAAADAGCDVKLVNIEGVATADEWRLKYTLAKTHVATIDANCVFFQLRADQKRSMPDIGLWPGPDTSQAALAIFDPKFSEKGGYSLRAYQQTQERYERDFSAPATVLEFHDRIDLKGPAPDWLLLGMRPGGASRSKFRQRVFAALSRNPGLAVFDVSSSYEEHLEAALATAQDLHDRGVLGRRYLTFSFGVEDHEDWAADRAAGQIRIRGQSVTRFGPVVELIRSSVAREVPIVLFTDGEFGGDGSVQALINDGYRVWCFPIDPMQKHD